MERGIRRWEESRHEKRNPGVITKNAHEKLGSYIESCSLTDRVFLPAA